MAQASEIEALKASFRGAVATAAGLAELQERVETLQPSEDVDEATLQDLARATSAHAVASAALRAFVERMIARRVRGGGNASNGG